MCVCHGTMAFASLVLVLSTLVVHRFPSAGSLGICDRISVSQRLYLVFFFCVIVVLFKMCLLVYIVIRDLVLTQEAGTSYIHTLYIHTMCLINPHYTTY